MDENLNEKPPPALYIITTMLVLMIAATAIVFWPQSGDNTTPEISVAHSEVSENEIMHLLAQMQREQSELSSQVRSFRPDGGLDE